jgi:lysophospholipase L1-like esterase
VSAAVARTAPAVPWKVRVSLAVGGVLLALLTAEATLRVSHFHFDFVPSLQFGWPDAVALRDAYAPDPDLIWVTHDYRDTLRAARRTHPAIVFMGDSCTEFGSYAPKTVAMLDAQHAALGTGVKLGVGGWSTEQGLLQLRRDVIPLHPRAVTIYFGWNDHWKAMGLTDPEIARTHRMRTLAQHLRLAQLWLWFETGLASKRSPPPNRVPLHDYEANLRAIATQARGAGIQPVFVTAPSNHVAGREPAYLAQRHVRSLAEVVPLHAQYAEMTRAVAAHTGSILCDAAAAFAALPQPHDRYFQKDGIHLTDAGDDEMARVLSACLAPLR